MVGAVVVAGLDDDTTSGWRMEGDVGSGWDRRETKAAERRGRAGWHHCSDMMNN
jgi:hypothetical protein